MHGLLARSSSASAQYTRRLQCDCIITSQSEFSHGNMLGDNFGRLAVDMDIHGYIYRYIHGYYAGAPAN